MGNLSYKLAVRRNVNLFEKSKSTSFNEQIVIVPHW